NGTGRRGSNQQVRRVVVSEHPFEYVAPDTLEEALALLRAHGAEATVLAGGQSLVPLLNYRLARPRLVMDITGLPLAHVRAEDGWLRVGGLARHHELEEFAEIARACPLLPEVARRIGNGRVGPLGTVGGSLAYVDRAAELPLAMVALDARLTRASASGRRTVAARDFFTGYLSTALGADELLTEIAVPVTRGMGWAVEEFARRAGDFAVVAVAAGVSLDRRGRVDDARVAFAGVADRPVRATAAEDALRGQEPSADRLARAAEIARDGLDPQSDAFVSSAYRRLLAGRPVSSCLVRAAAVRGRAIRTVRGLERDGALHPLQEAFVRHGAVQCGFCTPGMLLTALAFLERHPRASRDEVRGALAGNLCRCTGYAKILDAVQAYTRGHDGDG